MCMYCGLVELICYTDKRIAPMSPYDMHVRKPLYDQPSAQPSAQPSTHTLYTHHPLKNFRVPFIIPGGTYLGAKFKIFILNGFISKLKVRV